MALVVKNPPDNAGDARDAGSVHGSGRSPGGGHTTHSSILVWRIPWTEEPGWLQSMGSQRVEHSLVAKTTKNDVILSVEGMWRTLEFWPLISVGYTDNTHQKHGQLLRINPEM